MYIKSTSRYLQYISHGLETVIAPLVEGEQASFVMDSIQLALRELHKRETRTPAMLQESLGEGNALAAEMLALLDTLEGSCVLRSDYEALVADANAAQEIVFAVYLQLYNRANALIERLGAALSLARVNANEEQNAEIGNLLRRAAEWDFAFMSAQSEPIEFEPFDLPPPLEGEDVNAENLKAFVESQLDGVEVTVRDLARVPGGNVKRTYSCTLDYSDGRSDDVIIRKEEQRPVFNRGAASIHAEYAMLQEIVDTGFPAPEPYYLAHRQEPFDTDFFIMRRMPGSPAGTLFGPLVDMTEELLLDIAANMARLHSIPIENFDDYFARYVPDLLGCDIETAYRKEIEYYRHYYTTEQPGTPCPSAVFLIDWLLENIPQTREKPVLVHGDFNLQNMLVENGRVSAVFDWESVMPGDPAQELAYIQPHIEQYIEWDKFLQHYYDNGGRQIDENLFTFARAFSNIRGVVGTAHNMTQFDLARNDDVRYLAHDMQYFPMFTGNAIACAK